MQKITNWIFEQSPRKLAIYLLIYPLVLVVAHTALSITHRNLTEANAGTDSIIYGAMTLALLLFAIPLLIWLLWLKGAVFSVDERQLGIPIRWFRWALIIFIIYLIFTFCFSYMELMSEEVRHIFSVLNEGIGFAGLLLAYPIICHYAARAVYVVKNSGTATVSNSIGYTVLLMFIPFSIPFLHHYFNGKAYEKSKLIPVYIIAIGLCVFIFIGTFIAALAGLI